MNRPEKRRAGNDSSTQVQEQCGRQTLTNFPRAAHLLDIVAAGDLRTLSWWSRVSRHDRKRRHEPWPITLSLGLSKLLPPSSALDGKHGPKCSDTFLISEPTLAQCKTIGDLIRMLGHTGRCSGRSPSHASQDAARHPQHQGHGRETECNGHAETVTREVGLHQNWK
jgi:hypothetical protein